MIIEKAYAKVNLFINVLGVRKDGYHNLEMINAKIDLFDTIKIEKIETPGMALVVSNDLFLSNQNNIVHDVATHMIQTFVPDQGVKIEIDKKIPFGAGLAGNSTDAASIIKGMNRLFDLKLTFPEMAQIGLQYGADIPYCLVDYPALVEGVGEKITKLDFDLRAYQLLLLNPRVYVATKEIFTIGDRKGFQNVDSKNILKAIKKQDMDRFIASMHNALQKISVENHIEVKRAEAVLKEHFGEEGLVMTGSGSTFVKILKQVDHSVEAFLSQYKEQYFVQTYRFL